MVKVEWAGGVSREPGLPSHITSMPRDCLEEVDWLWVPCQEPHLSAPPPAFPTLSLHPTPLSLVLREAERTQAGRGGDRLDRSQPEAQAHGGPGVCGPEPAAGGATGQVECGECVGLVWRGLGAGRQGGRITVPLPRGQGCLEAQHEDDEGSLLHRAATAQTACMWSRIPPRMLGKVTNYI